MGGRGDELVLYAERPFIPSIAELRESKEGANNVD
jgi:hypothetical protein